MTRRTPSAEHAKAKKDAGERECGECAMGAYDQKHTSHTVKTLGVDGKRFLFSPDEEKKRREKVPKRVEK